MLATTGGLAFLTGAEEFGLAKEEAHLLADAYVGVARHYDWLNVSEKALDWGRLFSALSMVVGPRIFAYRLRTAKPKAPAPPKPPETQPPMTSPQPPAAQRQNGAVIIPGVGAVNIPAGAI